MSKIKNSSFNQELKDQAYELYKSIFEKKWNISKQDFLEIIFKDEENLVQISLLDENYQLEGFLIAYINENKLDIKMIIVKPLLQRKGLGKSLLEEALKIAKEKGLKKVLPGGSSSYLWCGVPKDLEGSVNFFKKNGFVEDHIATDLILSLDSWQLRDYKAYLNNKDIKIKPLKIDEINNLINFENSYFRDWTRYFLGTIKAGYINHILVAKNKNEIVGSVIVDSPKFSHHKWSAQFNSKVGSLGALGVKPEFRKQGIGIALVIEGTNLLRQELSAVNYIEWTTVPGFYQKLGFKPYSEFSMLVKEV